MKISENWLRQYISTTLNTEKIADVLTDIGLEVEGVDHFETITGGLQGIVVGKVMTCAQHPNADKLKLTTVDIGADSALQIVCGAPNVAEGQTVAVATVGAKIQPKGSAGFEIKEAKIRGEKSQGMLCSEQELGIGDDSSGIMILDEDQYVVGTPLAQYFENYEDQVFEIGLTPNRSDAMSHFGVARDLYAALQSNGVEAELEKIAVPKIEVVDKAEYSIEIEDSKGCPRYCGIVIDRVAVADSPDWLQNKLLSIGLKPINNVVDITNYMLHAYGQPLHAFDAEKITDKKIMVGPATPGATLTTLDGVERTLSGQELVIKDGSGQPLCLAGVMGGAESGVGEQSTKIFLESAYFNPVVVRKAAKAHGISSDSSFRFERGADPAFTKKALQIATQLIIDICGGVVDSTLLEHYPEEIKEHYIILRTTKIEQILGVKIHREKVKEILKNLEITILNEIPTGYELAVPAYRADVTREIDVIEEILRIYGYNKIDIPQKFSFSHVQQGPDDLSKLEDRMASALQTMGFHEVMNNSLTHLQDESCAVKILNPLSAELGYMRTNLWEGLLENTAFNINRKSADLKLFEIGKTYAKAGEGYAEEKKLAILQTGRQSAETWLTPAVYSDFYQLKGVVEQLLSGLTIDVQEEYFSDDVFADGLSFKADGRMIGKIGMFREETLRKSDVAQNCYYAELNFLPLHKYTPAKNFTFNDLPKFNKIRRDLALLVDQDVSYQAIKQAVEQLNNSAIRNIRLFDVYTGKNLPEGKKSYAISLEILNIEKTLEESEIGKVMDEVISAITSKTGAVLR